MIYKIAVWPQNKNLYFHEVFDKEYKNLLFIFDLRYLKLFYKLFEQTTINLQRLKKRKHPNPIYPTYTYDLENTSIITKLATTNENIILNTEQMVSRSMILKTVNYYNLQENKINDDDSTEDKLVMMDDNSTCYFCKYPVLKENIYTWPIQYIVNVISPFNTNNHNTNNHNTNNNNTVNNFKNIAICYDPKSLHDFNVQLFSNQNSSELKSPFLLDNSIIDATNHQPFINNNSAIIYETLVTTHAVALMLDNIRALDHIIKIYQIKHLCQLSSTTTDIWLNDCFLKTFYSIGNSVIDCTYDIIYTFNIIKDYINNHEELSKNVFAAYLIALYNTESYESYDVKMVFQIGKSIGLYGNITTDNSIKIFLQQVGSYYRQLLVKMNHENPCPNSFTQQIQRVKLAYEKLCVGDGSFIGIPPHEMSSSSLRINLLYEILSFLKKNIDTTIQMPHNPQTSETELCQLISIHFPKY